MEGTVRRARGSARPPLTPPPRSCPIQASLLLLGSCGVCWLRVFPFSCLRTKPSGKGGRGSRVAERRAQGLSRETGLLVVRGGCEVLASLRTLLLPLRSPPEAAASADRRPSLVPQRGRLWVGGSLSLDRDGVQAHSGRVAVGWEQRRGSWSCQCRRQPAAPSPQASTLLCPEGRHHLGVHTFIRPLHPQRPKNTAALRRASGCSARPLPPS